MADPVRLRIQKKLSAALEAINPADGYTYDLSGAVVRGRIAIGESDPVPLVSILEVPVPPDQHDSPYASHSFDGPWDLIIQGWAPDDPQHPTDPAHYLMADVKRRLRELMDISSSASFKKRYILDEPGVLEMAVTPGVVRPAEAQSRFAFFWLSVRIHLVEKLGE